MGLLNPTPGEIVDRISILQIKAQHAGGQGPGRCRDEIIALKDVYNPGSFELKVLSIVNATIWNLENIIRRLACSGSMAALGPVAAEIATMNNLRWEVVKAINEEKKPGTYTEEKVYDANDNPHP